MQDNIHSEDYYSKVIPTAWIVAYRRTFTDIPFSKEIFEKLDEIQNSGLYSQITEEMMAARLAPQIEARYKLLNKMILQNPHEQILELAIGFSPRGLEFSKYEGITYVETDLPLVIEEKKKMSNSILKTNTYFVSGNVLNSLDDTTKYFSKNKPVTVIHEGLLRYMNFEEKAIIAKNVYTVLEKFGGVWITPDITLQNVLYNENKNVKEHNKKIQSMTGINTDNNRFDNEEQAQKFFKNLGFNIERHSFMEVKYELVSPKILNLPEDVVNEMIEFPVVYVMRIK